MIFLAARRLLHKTQGEGDSRFAPSPRLAKLGTPLPGAGRGGDRNDLMRNPILVRQQELAPTPTGSGFPDLCLLGVDEFGRSRLLAANMINNVKREAQKGRIFLVPRKRLSVAHARLLTPDTRSLTNAGARAVSTLSSVLPVFPRTWPTKRPSGCFPNRSGTGRRSRSAPLPSTR